MGRKRKAPKGMQWRGNNLYSEFQIKGVPIRKLLRTDNPAIAEKRLEALRVEVNAEAFGGGPRLMIDVMADWKAHMKGNSDHKKWRGKSKKPSTDTAVRCCRSRTSLKAKSFHK